MAETWIVYKAENMGAQGWEERMLMPSAGLTDILHEEWWSDGDMPKVGDRVYDSKQDDDGVVHARNGDWVVSQIQQFSSFDTDERIVVCYCTYAPVKAEWEVIERGAPVAEMMAATHQARY